MKFFLPSKTKALKLIACITVPPSILIIDPVENLVEYFEHKIKPMVKSHLLIQSSLHDGALRSPSFFWICLFNYIPMTTLVYNVPGIMPETTISCLPNSLAKVVYKNLVRF